MKEKRYIDNMSKHLFWDVDVDTIDVEAHKAYIVQRVLEYGLWDDWMLLRRSLGLNQIVQISKGLRTLEPRALAYLSIISKTPKEEFRCYNTQQSNPQLWNF